MEQWHIPGKEYKPKVDFYTLAELAHVCGLAPGSFRKYIQKGIIPDANFRKPGREYFNKSLNAKVTVAGARLYTVGSLAPKLKAVFSQVKQGRSMTVEQKQLIIKAFQEERLFIEQY